MPLKNYHVLLVDIDLPTLSILPPYVLSTQSQPAPSPTALIGALMRAVRRHRDGVLDETAPIEEIVKNAFEEGILYALFWVPPYASTFSLERVFTMTYQRADRAGLLTEENVTKCLGDLLTIEDTGSARMVSEECREFCDGVIMKMWNVAPRGLVTYATTAHILYITTNRDLARWAWLITRLGRREDVAFVRNVSVFNLGDLIVDSISGNESLGTRFYMPSRLVVTAHGERWVMREVVNGVIREEEFVVPVAGPRLVPMTYKPRVDGAVIIRVPVNGAFEFVQVPREVVGLLLTLVTWPGTDTYHLRGSPAWRLLGRLVRTCLRALLLIVLII
jgi:CRISPR/Cas system-associated protein Cas5 (RAMP superfamily)